MSTCRTCQHSSILQQRSAPANAPMVMRCLRYPPTPVGGIVPNQGGTLVVAAESHWPLVQPDERCGEHLFTMDFN